MKQKQEISEQIVFSLVQFYAVVLFECNEAEDYGPAMTLMYTAFTFHHEGKHVRSSYQYRTTVIKTTDQCSLSRCRRTSVFKVKVKLKVISVLES